MKKPKILLSGNKKLSDYINAVSAAGGIAVAKYLPELDDNYDGLILCGGNDISPSYYREEVNGSIDIDAGRDVVEFSLLKAFVDAGKPVFGICRGCQLINVFFGGTLYQHLENADEHSSAADYDLIHRVTAVRGSIMECLYGTDFSVNSFHHQAIKELGDRIKVTMRSADGSVIEGICHESFPIIGVQWHPERLRFNKYQTDVVDGATLFRYFIQMCHV